MHWDQGSSRLSGDSPNGIKDRGVEMTVGRDHTFIPDQQASGSKVEAGTSHVCDSSAGLIDDHGAGCLIWARSAMCSWPNGPGVTVSITAARRWPDNS
jgi:hypothetical protein